MKSCLDLPALWALNCVPIIGMLWSFRSYYAWEVLSAKVPSEEKRRECWKAFYQGAAFPTLARFLLLGAVYGTYEAIRFKVPGLMKIRYIGQTTLGSAAIFGLFLGAGSLIHCGKSY
ncbi:uncharacterized protein LOC142639571 [Castanea sativa]|uniref:uncharacterized protein LOC142639571 n=1 Tax=Castanea sativa TaxID=21020 RepID=UPI003F64C24F